MMKSFVCHPDNRRPLDDSPDAGDAVALLGLLRTMKRRGLGPWRFTFGRADADAVMALYYAGLIEIRMDPDGGGEECFALLRERTAQHG